MAGGPLHWHSAVPTTDNAFPNTHIGAGVYSKHDEGLGVAASITADAIWRLRFQLPQILPTGTPKLYLRGLANGLGDARITTLWAQAGWGGNPSAIPLSSEAQVVETWSVGVEDTYRDVRIPLSAATLVAGLELLVDLRFDSLSWTLDAVSTWIITIIWE